MTLFFIAYFRKILAVEQETLFESNRPAIEKRERLEKTVDNIREKFGHASLLPGSVVGNDLGIDEKE